VALLGIDVGTTHTKVGVFDVEGGALAHLQAPTPRKTSPAGYVHFPPEALWRQTAGLVRRAVAGAGGKVAALAVASMGEAGVTLDAAGKPTYPIIPWNDNRTAAQMTALTGKLEPPEWFRITGLFPNPIHSIAKWLWLEEHAPEAWRITRRWLSVTGYIRYRLTGVAVMEASQAARTMAFDVRSGEWSRELLELAGLTADFLPPIVSACQQVGEVSPEAAALTGLPAGTPVFAGGHDHICAALACGAFTPEVALDSLGTAEALTLGLPTPPNPEGSGGFGTGPHVIAGHSYLMGGIYSSGGALAWLRKTLGFEDFEALREAAATTEAGTAPLFIARFHGAAPPFNDPAANGAFVELRPEHTPAHLARAVYEGIACEIRAGIEALERLTGRPVQLIRMVGGSAGDPFWSKIRASVLGRPLEVAHHPDMVTAGAALVAGLGAGLYKDPQDAVARTYRAARTFHPTSPDASTTAYEQLYRHYRRAAEALAGYRGDSYREER